MLRTLALIMTAIVVAQGEAAATPPPHAINFGKWMAVKSPDRPGQKLHDLKVRALFVGGRLKEYTTGAPHEVTDRLFVVRRVLRLNDALPEENATRWQWQRGVWLLVDRTSGRIRQLTLPEFDPFYSTASWYRDYVAYCGVSEDSRKRYAMVTQVGRRKPVLKKLVAEFATSEVPESECPAPSWERVPARVTFQSDGSQKLVFSIRGHAMDAAQEPEEGAEEQR